MKAWIKTEKQLLSVETPTVDHLLKYPIEWIEHIEHFAYCVPEEDLVKIGEQK